MVVIYNDCQPAQQLCKHNAMKLRSPPWGYPPIKGYTPMYARHLWCSWDVSVIPSSTACPSLQAKSSRHRKLDIIGQSPSFSTKP
eukprot:CAMPEP_0183466084 /NCGR_PEP_ID=MMETSP0370-20130417/148341_1 /TAXON_ID=268820 /ORGANISM="Peridinium aciculiferum, Strain PAER-2" /LENGTH=84 /DNA_ID=CAMNT_0025658335 /DNA_START=17 /DNA_END=268 /DNA_ORIENTATION=+